MRHAQTIRVKVTISEFLLSLTRSRTFFTSTKFSALPSDFRVNKKETLAVPLFHGFNFSFLAFLSSVALVESMSAE